jgi:hypothetical protein
MTERKELVGAIEQQKDLTCGLIMPISTIDGCGPEHWLEVKAIISEAILSISDYKFKVGLVSDQDDVGVIQKRIVQNVYNSDIVVCDVSCKNPNVMFELGMRLAFDKPIVLIKDDKTDYSFDTGVIEHVNYPRDLRFSKINTFKTLLAEKVASTYKVYTKNNENSFLSSFGTFKVAAIKQTEGTPDQLMMDMLQEISKEITSLRKSNSSLVKRSRGSMSERTLLLTEAVMAYLAQNPKVKLHEVIGRGDFYDAIESKISNLQIFNSRREFESAVDDFVMTTDLG